MCVDSQGIPLEICQNHGICIETCKCTFFFLLYQNPSSAKKKIVKTHNWLESPVLLGPKLLKYFSLTNPQSYFMLQRQYFQLATDGVDGFKRTVNQSICGEIIGHFL